MPQMHDLFSSLILQMIIMQAKINFKAGLNFRAMHAIREIYIPSAKICTSSYGIAIHASDISTYGEGK